MLGFFFLEGVVGFNFYNSTDQILSQNICMQIYETTFFFKKWNNVNKIKKNVKRKLYQGSFCSLSTAHM